MRLVVNKIINEDKSLHHYNHDDISFCCKKIEEYWDTGSLSSNSDGKVVLYLHENWGDGAGDPLAIDFCPLCGVKTETVIGKTFIRKKECKEVVRKETVCNYILEELKENE